MMNCATIRRYLTLYLDSELGPEMTFEISRHLDECSACQKVFEQESHLESQLRSMVTAGRDTDDELWSRVCDRVVQARSTRFVKSPAALGILSVAAVVVFLVLSGVIDSLRHHELDLAAATEEAHVDFLEKPSLHFAAAGSIDKVKEYFKEHLSQSFMLSEIAMPDVKFFGGSLCSVRGIRTAHLLYYANQTPVSVFWLDRKDLWHFPDVSEKLSVQPPSLHCKVNNDQFYVRQTQNAVVCGIGDIAPGQLQELVDLLSTPQEANRSDSMLNPAPH